MTNIQLSEQLSSESRKYELVWPLVLFFTIHFEPRKIWLRIKPKNKSTWQSKKQWIGLFVVFWQQIMMHWFFPSIYYIAQCGQEFFFNLQFIAGIGNPANMLSNCQKKVLGEGIVLFRNQRIMPKSLCPQKSSVWKLQKPENALLSIVNTKLFVTLKVFSLLHFPVWL